MENTLDLPLDDYELLADEGQAALQKQQEHHQQRHQQRHPARKRPYEGDEDNATVPDADSGYQQQQPSAALRKKQLLDDDDHSVINTNKATHVPSSSLAENPLWAKSPYEKQLTAPRRKTVAEFYDVASKVVAEAPNPKSVPLPHRTMVQVMARADSVVDIDKAIQRDEGFDFRFEPAPILSYQELLNKLGPSPPASHCLGCRLALGYVATTRGTHLERLMSMWLRFETYASEEVRYYRMEAYCDREVIKPHNTYEELVIWPQTHPNVIMPQHERDKRLLPRWTARSIHDHFMNHVTDDLFRALRDVRRIEMLANEYFLNGLNIVDTTDPAGLKTHKRHEYTRMYVFLVEKARAIAKSIDTARQKAIIEADKRIKIFEMRDQQAAERASLLADDDSAADQSAVTETSNVALLK